MGKKLSNLKNGFTIVELLIVIVIIGILATITAISYSSITQRAVGASLVSDLSNAAEQLKIYKIQNGGSYPASYALDCSNTPATNTICFKTSSGNIIPTLLTDNTANPKTFCIRASHGAINYFVTNSTDPAPGRCPGIPHTQTIAYTGAQQTFTVPADVTSVNVDAYGAAGNPGGVNSGGGGLGGRAKGDIAVNPGDVLYIYVGGQAGFNGGANGAGEGGYNPSCGDTNSVGGLGGGATDVRLGGTTITPTDYRKIVAGGGGGAGGGMYGGDCGYGGGNGLTGGGSGGGGCATKGTGCVGAGGGGGGGGGGYYGGRGGSSSIDAGGSGGSGGSGYLGGVTSGSYPSSGNSSGNGQVILYWETPS